MRIPILAGNWKMNLLRREVDELLGGLRDAVRGVEGREIVVFPAFPYLERAVRALEDTRIRVGAQDCAAERAGAFTGAVSPEMVKDVGATHVVLGHSERRQLFGETDADVNRKLRAALAEGLTAIVCVGETLAERDRDETWAVVERQLAGALADLDADACAALVIAYEPVWAIGTGRTATPEQAQEVHAAIRADVERRFHLGLSAGIRILYGGSVNPANIDGLMAMPDIDGGLVGGASLRAADFARIVRYETPR